MDAFEVNNEEPQGAEAVLETLDAGSDAGSSAAAVGEPAKAANEADAAAAAEAEESKSAPAADLGPAAGGLDSYLAQGTEYERVTVGDPQQGGNALRSYYTYSVAVQPPRPGVSQVRRRYRDFEWLRATLVTMFPGLFVPPLPPKQLFGRDSEFITERAEELERFMCRVCQHYLFASTAAFNVFVTRHENRFESGRKEVDRDVTRQGAIYDTLELYLRAFPNALRLRLPDDAEEGVLRLKTFLETSEQSMVLLEKQTHQLAQQLGAVAATQASITRIMGKVAKTEDEYAQRPEPERLDTDSLMRFATRQRRENADFSQKHLYKGAHHELLDIRAFLELIKYRYQLRATYEKFRAKGDKWRDPNTSVSAKQEQQRKDELKTEEESKNTLEIVTKIILSDQVKRWWADKTSTFEKEMRGLALRLAVQSRETLASWGDLVDEDEVERELAERAE